MKKKVTVLLLIIAIGLAALCAICVMAEDRTAPVITVPSAAMTYQEGADTASLLVGVAAKDNRDGDLSDRVRVYDVSPMADRTSALVTYAVYDDNYNLGKATKIIGYVPEADSATGTVTEGDDAEASDQTGEEETTQEATTEATTTEAQTVEPGYEDPDLVSTGAPVIRLSTHEVKISVGGYFYAMGYVENAVDDKDTREELYRNIKLEGDYDVDTAGSYEITYYCTDSDGNTSNLAKLMLIVGEDVDSGQ